MTGAPGAIQVFTVVFHVPTMPSSCLCCGPGVMAFCHASIMAFSSADICGGWPSCAKAVNDMKRHRAPVMNQVLDRMRFLLIVVLARADSIAVGLHSFGFYSL